MPHLRLIRSGTPVRGPGAECLDAFDRELDYLYTLLQRFGALPSDVEDLLQEIFVILHGRWTTLDLSRPLRPWLFGVAFRVVRDHRRRRAREARARDLPPPDPVRDAEAEMHDRQSLALFAAGLQRIPVELRTVLTLHLEGVEVIEMARRLRMTKFGVYARLYKARRELRSALRRLERPDGRP